MVWTRLLLAVVSGGGLGFGAFFLALGLLPGLPPTGPAPWPERRTERDGGIEIRAPEGDSPELRAENRRLAIACGIGCVSGAAAVVSLFSASQRWVGPGNHKQAEPGRCT
jgi:hypothetical protein